MIQEFLIKLLLFPFALLYGLGVYIRNMLYDVKFLKSISFSHPVISIGNLSVGGTGKTPHVEYLVRELSPYIAVGVLSRGYGRKSKGFRFVHPLNTAEQVGDEPLQIKRKFPQAHIAVVENRALGIPLALKHAPGLKVILLDDAFQHRSVKPGLNILLTDSHSLFRNDFLLPMGRLREFRGAYKRADIIVVTKTAPDMTQKERDQITNVIKPKPYQKIYFSYFSYLHPYNIWNPSHSIVLNSDLSVLLVSAIANTEYLLDYLENKVHNVRSIEFEDHHYFSNSEIGNLKKHYYEIPSDNKIIVTTEKDATRLALHKEYLVKENLPIFVLPVKAVFHPTNEKPFIDEVKSFLLDFRI